MSDSHKQFRFDQDARHSLVDGIGQLADAVAITLGPRGRNVGLQAKWGSPAITSDGYSIAKEIEFKDPFLNMGASLAKEVCAKIKDASGDGTTTGIVLLRALVQGAAKQIAAGASPVLLKRGMEQALALVLREIDAMAQKVKGDEVRHAAAVSASGDAEIGRKIAECFAQCGQSGVILIEEGKGTETAIEFVEGMQLEKGYTSAYFCTNAEKMLVEMESPWLLITDKKISSAQEILGVLQHVAASGANLVIVAEEIDGDALSTLVMNKLRGTLKVAAIKAPGFGDSRKAMLQDLAVFTGAELVSEEKGMQLRDAKPEWLGRAAKVAIGKEKTTIVEGAGTEKAVKARVAEIDAEIKRAGSAYDREKLEARKAKLTGCVAQILVGAMTESEMKKKKQLYEDSLSSTRAALEEGIVPGGGVTLLRAARAVDCSAIEEGECRAGARILLAACDAPFKQIASNAGFDGAVLLEEVLHAARNIGFNVVTEKVEDLMAAGVVDPAKIVKNCLLFAVSVAGVACMTEALIADGALEKNG